MVQFKFKLAAKFRSRKLILVVILSCLALLSLRHSGAGLAGVQFLVVFIKPSWK